ncbi:MAG: hypothetical protein WD875_12440 [Pirellulales bacterium]
MPFYAILIFCGAAALFGAMLLGGEGLSPRRRRRSSGLDSSGSGDGGWSFGGPTDYNDSGTTGFDDD